MLLKGRIITLLSFPLFLTASGVAAIPTQIKLSEPITCTFVVKGAQLQGPAIYPVGFGKGRYFAYLRNTQPAKVIVFDLINDEVVAEVEAQFKDQIATISKLTQKKLGVFNVIPSDLLKLAKFPLNYDGDRLEPSYQRKWTGMSGAGDSDRPTYQVELIFSSQKYGEKKVADYPDWEYDESEVLGYLRSTDPNRIVIISSNLTTSPASGLI